MNNLGQTFIYIWAVAMLAIFISGIIFIVNTIKKKDHKTIKKVFISSVIVAIACFVLYGITSPVTRCKHEYTTILDQAATCTEDGKKEQHCPLCDFTKKETFKATGHKMETKSKIEPTYDTEGEQVDVCSVCGYEEITKIDMLVKETTTEATTKGTTTKQTTTKPTTTKEPTTETNTTNTITVISTTSNKNENTTSKKTENDTNEIDISYSAYEKNFFIDYYTFDEYKDLCLIASKKSAKPCYAISEYIFVVHKNISTYNSNEDSYMILDKSGKIIKDYGDNTWVASLVNFKKIGKFGFVAIKGNPSTFDVFDSKGNFLYTFKAGNENQSLNKLYNLGEEYYIFSTVLKGKYTLYVLDPKGNYNILSLPKGYSLYYQEISSEAIVGNMSDGLVSFICKDFKNETVAFYFNHKGEKVVDLSSLTTNYSVIKLGDFDNGKARIEFIGADKKTYSAVIDKKGEFIKEPVRL